MKYQTIMLVGCFLCKKKTLPLELSTIYEKVLRNIGAGWIDKVLRDIQAEGRSLCLA